VNELVGQTFYGTLLKTMRSSSLKASYGHGGRGEEVFQGQLDMLLAQRMGQAKQFKLNDAIYRSLMKGVTAKGTAPSTGTQSPQAAWSPTGRRAERGNAERDCPLPSGGETR
jgi:Rod binding domain-containing protein